MKRSFLKQLMRVGNIIPGIAVLSIGIPGFFIASTLVAHADTIGPITFEQPTYTIGLINGQDGWSALGASGSGCAVYDEGVADSLGTTGFGSQSFRISNAVTSGCFGDQAFSKSLTDEAGETTDAVNGGFSGGTRQPHFEAQFSIASAEPTAPVGSILSVSPDRGDGARMSYLRFEDGTGGINVFFDDVTDPTHTTNKDAFNETQIATLDRTVPHTIKFSMDFVDGPDNDVVKIYIDGALVHTGTSWEDYYRYDTESQGDPHDPALENKTRTVDSLLFRAGGTADTDNLGKGYLIDNLSLESGPIPTPPPTSAQVHIFKYLDGTQATAVSANNVSFPMLTTYNDANIGSGTNVPFTLNPNGWTTGDVAYEASTGARTIGSSASFSEDTSGAIVAPDCSTGDPYTLVGYSTGDTLADAAATTPTLTAPNFADLSTDEYVVVWNKTCPPPPTFTVTIDKFIDGKMATAGSAASAAFPMVSSWNATNLGAPGSGSYSLSTVGFNSPNAYEAVTSPMISGSSYTTNEVTNTPLVGADCTVGDPYALVGYSTGATLADAESAATSTATPTFTNLTSNEYVVVWNKDCLPAPTLLSPTNGTVTTTAGLTSTDWNPVTDPAGGITYIYQASNSSTTNPDGSFTSPVYTSGPLTDTMIPTPGTPAGVYFWHVQAMDADGNVSPWSNVWSFTVANTGTFVVEKDTIGGDGTFTFTTTNGLGNFSITSVSGVGTETFNNVTPGTYTVTETNLPKGWTQTDTSCSSVVVTAGGVDICVITDTINSKLGEIRGTKYVDVDGDGKLTDGDHHRLAGVTIYLDTNNNGVLDLGEPSMVTDKFGNYHFSNLPAGTYHVREVEQAGWMETVPASGSYTIVLAAGKVSKNDNFGDFKLGTISGMKYNDLNGNGRKDKNEPGLAGWTITLTKLHSTFTETAVTNASGTYSFTNLGPGTYQLREVSQTGWYETSANPANVTIHSGTVSKNDNFGNHFGKMTKYSWYNSYDWDNGFNIGFGGGR